MNERPTADIRAAEIQPQVIEIDWGKGERSLSAPAKSFTLNRLTDTMAAEDDPPFAYALALRFETNSGDVGVHIALSAEEALRIADYIRDTVTGKA